MIGLITGNRKTYNSTARYLEIVEHIHIDTLYEES